MASPLSAFCFLLFTCAPLHPNCYLSPTQFAEKFGLAKPEGNYGIDGKHGKGEEEKGDAGGGKAVVSTETAPEPEVVTPPLEHSDIKSPQSEIRPGLRLSVVLFLLAGSVVLTALITLIATGYMNAAAIEELARRLFRL